MIFNTQRDHGQLGSVSGMLLLVSVASLLPSACSAQTEVTGRVVDEDGHPFANALVSHYWRANGSPRRDDGTEYDLLNAKQNERFWGRVGEMAPWNPPVRSDEDGRFSITLPERFQHLYAITPDHKKGAISILNAMPEKNANLQLELKPLIQIRGQMKSSVATKDVDWAHVYVELAFDPKRPLMMRRLISCGTYDNGKFAFQVPPGNFRLDAYANSDRSIETTDLKAEAVTKFEVDDSAPNLNLGTIALHEARPGRVELEASAKEQGHWRDYTEHYGEPAPPWHAIAVKGMPESTTLKDLRGKWVLINFWGMSCVPCLAHGVPQMINFYDEHAEFRDQFEIVGLCVDLDDRFPTFEQLDKSLRPIVRHAWAGKEITYPLVLDNTFQSWERYGIPGLGTVVLIDPDGNLHEGDEQTLARILSNREKELEDHNPQR